MNALANFYCEPVVGYPLLLTCAGLVVCLTVATYLVRAHMTFRRLVVLLVLRLTALVLAFLVILRPTYSTRAAENPASRLVIVLDYSTSMNNRDELDGASRWEYALRMLKESKPALDRLRDEANVTISFSRFGPDVADFDPDNPGQADGTRTDFTRMLKKLYERNSAAGAMRGLIVISDGADNGANPDRKTQAENWRALPCRVHTFVCGKPTSNDHFVELAELSTDGDSGGVPVKNDLKVTGIIHSTNPGNTLVDVQLFVDDGKVPVATTRLTVEPGKDNKVELTCQAPEKPGEMKVSLKMNAGQEQVVANKELSSYVTVTREGVSILFIDRSRFPEPQSIFFALDDAERKRFKINRYWLTDEQVAAQKDPFQFAKQQYDVIFLGDVTLDQLEQRDPQFLKHLTDQVKTNRVGLIWAPGKLAVDAASRLDGDYRTFEQLLPVDLKGIERKERPFHLEPAEGWNTTLMRIAANEAENAKTWGTLRSLGVVTKFGSVKAGATVLARRDEDPVFVSISPPAGREGRVLALGVDSTAGWIERSNKGSDAIHRRFWQQIMLWLAHQEEAPGDIWIENQTQEVGKDQAKKLARSILSGSEISFEAGLRDSTGLHLKGGQFEGVMIMPGGVKKEVHLQQLDMGVKGTFADTDEPGEYRLEVKGSGHDREGKPIPEKPDAPPATLRYIVRPNTAELTQKAAKPDILRDLSTDGGGEFHEVKDLPKFLRDLQQQPFDAQQASPRLLPDWKSESTPGLSILVIILFTGLISSEWFCRRKWGMV